MGSEWTARPGVLIREFDAAADYCFRRFAINFDVIPEFAEFMPIFVDVDPREPRLHLPRLIKHSDPLGGVQKNSVRLSRADGFARAVIA